MSGKKIEEVNGRLGTRFGLSKWRIRNLKVVKRRECRGPRDRENEWNDEKGLTWFNRGERKFDARSEN